MFQYVVGAVAFFVVGMGAWFGIADAPTLSGHGATDETSNALFEVSPDVPDTNASAERFSDTEPEFEKVDDELVLAVPSVPQPIVSGSRVRWSQYWRPFSAEELQVYGSWKRPDGPVRVGVQAGHWQLDGVPQELIGLKQSTGAYGGGYSEQKLVLDIAERVKDILEAEGIEVDLLPATVPVDYIADAFVSVHADGNDSPSVSGYKISGPRRDFSGGADDLVDALYKSYGEATGLSRDSNVTRRMSGYYAFNWRRYDHAAHPMTPSAIVETGFVTSPTDRAIIVSKPSVAARGIADGIIAFLSGKGLL